LLLSQLNSHDIRARLRNGGLRLRMGDFTVHLTTSLSGVADGISLMYGGFPLIPEEGFADFHVSVDSPSGLRRWFRPQVLFSHDGYMPFKPLPVEHGYAQLEWGLNWCISSHCHQYLVIHAGVIEKNGYAVILPAPPGSGKSTLCAALVQRGWRLLSDELALVSRHDGLLKPIARPVNLKNQSIDVIRAFEPTAVIGTPANDTSKGTVAHMRAPAESIARAQESAQPAWVIFPKYEAGSTARLSPMPKGNAFIELAESAFNYSSLGEEGFRVLADIIDNSDCYRFSYSSLDEAVAIFSALEPRSVSEPARQAAL
jgi:HprK-related kinase A